jgi:hypothetical protein
MAERISAGTQVIRCPAAQVAPVILGAQADRGILADREVRASHHRLRHQEWEARRDRGSSRG